MHLSGFQIIHKWSKALCVSAPNTTILPASEYTLQLELILFFCVYPKDRQSNALPTELNRPFLSGVKTIDATDDNDDDDGARIIRDMDTWGMSVKKNPVIV